MLMARSRVRTRAVLDVALAKKLARRASLTNRPALDIAMKPFLDHTQDAQTHGVPSMYTANEASQCSPM